MSISMRRTCVPRRVSKKSVVRVGTKRIKFKLIIQVLVSVFIGIIIIILILFCNRIGIENFGSLSAFKKFRFSLGLLVQK